MRRADSLKASGSHASRIPAAFLVAVMALALASTPAANATAIATSSLQLQSLTITPSAGSIVSSPFAVWYGIVSNSLGEGNGFAGSDDAGAGSAAVTWAVVSAAADSMALTESVSVAMDIPVFGSAHGEAQSRVAYVPFSITGTSGPVSVQFTATLLHQQALTTGDFSSGQSFVGFCLGLYPPDRGCVLLATFGNTIGADSSWASSGTWTLTTSQTLMAGDSYNLGAHLDARSDATVIPEPASCSLLLAGLLVPLVAGHVRRLRA